MNESDVCPTPQKRVYPNAKAAKQAVRRMLTYGWFNGLYQCRCGNWHLSSSSVQGIPERYLVLKQLIKDK